MLTSAGDHILELEFLALQKFIFNIGQLSIYIWKLNVNSRILVQIADFLWNLEWVTEFKNL